MLSLRREVADLMTQLSRHDVLVDNAISSVNRIRLSQTPGRQLVSNDYVIDGDDKVDSNN